MTDDNTHLAQLAYAAYGDTTDWKNYQGNPMPDWDQLGNTIQAAWINAANAIVDYLVGPEPLDD